MPMRFVRRSRAAAAVSGWGAAAMLVSAALTGCRPPDFVAARIGEARHGISDLRERWREWSERRRIADNPPCRFGQPTECAADRVCAFIAKDESRCFRRYAGSTRFVRFPFAPDRPVECPRGPFSADDRHAYLDSLFAVDLAPVDASSPPATIHAGIEGVAIVHRGDGRLGNHVRILDPRGYVLLYARLGEISVGDGQAVRTGDAIGTARPASAATRGSAPDVHISLNYSDEPVASDWIGTLSYYRDRPGALPPSIPFETQYCDPARADRCARVRSRAEELPCGPHALTTGARLRADWRD